MARPRAEVANKPTSNSLVSAATRHGKKKVANAYQGSDRSWQHECYRHYSICGEARYAARFMGNALSRAVMFVDKPGNGGDRVTEGPAHEAFESLFAGKMDQAQMLTAVGEHLTIAGECYLVGRTTKRDNEDDDGEIWEIVSPLEISATGDKWSLSIGEDDQKVPLSDDDVVIRIWSPLPGRRSEPDSPFRSLLPILNEIEWLTRHVFAQIRSRLAGAGILFLSDGMTFPPPPNEEGATDEPASEADAFLLSLADSMMTPIANPGDPASLVPIVVTGPGEEIDKVKLLTFWSELDSNALELRSEAIRRFALGMDLPPEQVLGMGSNGGTGGGRSNGVSHWGAWQIEESTIKMHVEPKLELLCDALTKAYLLPLLEEDTPGFYDEFVSYDSTALHLRPDRSQESLELYDRGLVKAEVVLRENGFDPSTEGMDDKEFRVWLLKKIAGGSATPEQVHAALGALGVILPALENPDAETREERPMPSLEEHPTRPKTPDTAALLSACDGLVWRALERAGNRYLNAKTRGKDKDRSIDPTMFHTYNEINGDGPMLLTDAFTYAPRVLDGIDDTTKVVSILKDYCLALFATGEEHTRDKLSEYLEQRR